MNPGMMTTGRERGKKVMVAMSGGVDSSVAAFLMKEAGHEVTGVTMCLGVKEEARRKVRCCGADAVEDARRVCDLLKIPHYVLDYSGELEEKVIAEFISEYCRGRTPNPCIECNRRLKFGSLLGKAKGLGFDFLATGHYAEISRDRSGYTLWRPKDRKKDQTYFLYSMGREALRSVLFPLGAYTKDEVRKIAKDAGLPVHGKRESQDICFVTQDSIRAFFSERKIEGKPGPITDRDENVLGIHHGVAFYTIGQRGGLGISRSSPLYVIGIDSGENRITVGTKKDLKSRALIADDPVLLAEIPRAGTTAKIRYRKKEAECRVTVEGSLMRVLFKEDQDAITPGQAVVIYQDDIVLGGGIIRRSLNGAY
ncbi:MAG: tRNA 2-thiouridine(34) synthase MnmA [Syntrophales bacterium]|nr:tRNA 2-thiouridine(34) synthase MnmA [Syntrophales bacterium]